MSLILSIDGSKNTASKNVDINEPDENGISPLQYAACHDPSHFEPQWNAIQTLLDSHDGKLYENDGEYENSLLYYAVSGQNHLLVELLKRGVDPNLGGFFSFFFFPFPSLFHLSHWFTI